MNYLSQSWLIDRRHALRALGSFVSQPMFEEPKGGIEAQRRALRRKGSVLDDNLAEVRQLENLDSFSGVRAEQPNRDY